ncbi:response regulator transcription factor [Clostridium paraputrificum]|uniref:response regulator transcription factor n=1 Tax=Clostridium paraputrificum TaxID=29363 RepID=UPI003D34B9F8
MFKIMIVEDDKSLRKNIVDFLECKGYRLFQVSDFKNVEGYFDSINPQLILLDINLPYDDGFYLCGAIRRKSKVPIIIISARSRDIEQVMGIELGADDYITKPFSLELLAAKVNGLLRRCYSEVWSENDNVYGLMLDEKSFKISYKGIIKELSKNEFKLIKKFIENKDKVLSREELLEELWDYSSFIDDNTLTVNVTRVKNILVALNIKDTIKTKRGVGYIFDTTTLREGDR